MNSVNDSGDPTNSAFGRPRQRLARKLALLAFASSFLASLAVTWTSIESTQKSFRKFLGHQIPAAMQRVADRQLRWLQFGERGLSVLARHVGDEFFPENGTELPEWGLPEPALARTGSGSNMAATAEGREAIRTRLAMFLESGVASSSYFVGLAIVTGDGDILAASSAFDPAEFEGALVSTERPRLRASFHGNLQRLFAVTRSLGDSQLDARLVGVFRPLDLASEIAAESPLPGAAVSIFDPGGAFAMTAQPGLESVPTDPFVLARVAANVTGRVSEYSNEQGERVIGCALPLGLFGWQIAIEAPFDVVFEPLLSSAARMLAIEFCIVLLFSFVAYRITSIVVRPIEVLSDGVQLIADGLTDLEIPESASDDEAGLLSRAFNQMMRKLRTDQREIEKAHRELVERNMELQRANEVLNQLSITDGLTKLHNHRFFQDHLTREIKRVSRSHEPLTMILIDVDDFKGLNDRCGHAAGDEVLIRIARLMEDSVREVDLLARYGGEEFVVVASNTDLPGAYQLAEKIRSAIAETSFVLGESTRPTRLTVSVGIAQYEGNRKKFFTNADSALYSAKAQGKDCVVTFDGEK